MTAAVLSTAVGVILGVLGGWAASEWVGGFRVRHWQRQLMDKAHPPGSAHHSRAHYELSSRGLDPNSTSRDRRILDYFYRRKWTRRM